MKLTLTIEATPEDMQYIKGNMLEFAKEVEDMLKRRRLTTPIIRVKSSQGLPSMRLKI